MDSLAHTTDRALYYKMHYLLKWIVKHRAGGNINNLELHIIYTELNYRLYGDPKIQLAPPSLNFVFLLFG